MLRLLGIAWSAWKLSAKRLGPAGATVFAIGAVAAFVLLQRYLEDNYPRLGEAVETVA